VDRIINIKQLRASIPEIVKRVRKGECFTVLYRSSPAFRLVPATMSESIDSISLKDDPLYRAQAVGCSTDGLTASDHDRVLYGGKDN